MATSEGSTPGKERRHAASSPDRVIRVLRVADDPTDGPVPAPALATTGNLEVDVETDFAAALDAVTEGDVECAVVGHRTDGFDGLAFLEAIRRERPRFPVVLVPEDGGDEVAARAVQADVSAYVPPTMEDAAETVAASVEEAVPDVPPVDGEVRMPIKERTVTEEQRLKERAMDEAPVGITISDASHPDNPLVYVNDAFETMTGYGKEEAIGVNCRFLQGPETREGPVTELREAVEEERESTVELRNYREDGELFWNRLDIKPIRDEEGRVAHYVGFQLDVTERKRAERQVKREREDLRRLLDRIDGLLSDVTEVAVQAETRDDVHRTIVERIGEGGEFGDAWVGDYDPAGDVVTVSEWSGDDDALVRTDLPMDSDATVPRLVRKAIESGDPQVVEGIDVPRSPVAGADDEAFAVIPLTYRSTAYGVLTVYAPEGGVFDDREVAVLGAVGRAIGASINDVLSKRTMTTDSVIEIDVEIADPDLDLTALAAEAGRDLEHEGTHLQADGGLLMLFSVGGDDGEAVAEAATGYPSVEIADCLVADEDGSIVQLTVTDSPLVNALSEYGARIDGFTVTPSRQSVSFRVATERNARAVINHLEETYESVELMAYRESETPETTERGFRAAMESRLTERQRTALQKAYVSGFFDWPRRCDGDQLAESMDIVPSTFHQHLRAAERKLTEAFFEDL